MKQETFMAKPHGSSVDVEYKKWLTILKDRFKRAQIKAAVKVNSELLLFYWELGRDLVTKKAEEK